MLVPGAEPLQPWRDAGHSVRERHVEAHRIFTAPDTRPQQPFQRDAKFAFAVNNASPAACLRLVASGFFVDHSECDAAKLARYLVISPGIRHP